VTAPARLVAALLALVIAACSFLPWAGDRNAWHIALRSLTSAGLTSDSSPSSSIGLVVVVAAALVLLGDLVNRAAVVMVAALVTVAVPVVWIAVNALDRASAGLPMSAIRIGAYGCAAAGLMTLVLAAASVDHRGPAVR
jgi:hypothetical protein